MNPLIIPYRGEFSPKGISPTISALAFVAPGAVVVGDVEIGADSGFWFGCVARGDVNIIRIGERTNIQDGTVIHVTRHTGPTRIGSGVTGRERIVALGAWMLHQGETVRVAAARNVVQ